MFASLGTSLSFVVALTCNWSLLLSNHFYINALQTIFSKPFNEPFIVRGTAGAYSAFNCCNWNIPLHSPGLPWKQGIWFLHLHNCMVQIIYSYCKIRFRLFYSSCHSVFSLPVNNSFLAVKKHFIIIVEFNSQY